MVKQIKSLPKKKKKKINEGAIRTKLYIPKQITSISISEFLTFLFVYALQLS